MTNSNLPQDPAQLAEVAKALSEPIVKLIDSVSNAIGTLYEPTGIRRKAQAEADAAIILAKNHAEIQEIEFRAAKRLRDKEIRRQKNIESITEKAMKALPSTVSDKPVDEDWIYNFYERSQDISDEQMQEYWARILAGEVAQPGSFSRRTLETVKTLSANEAKMFANCCRFVWEGEDEENPSILIVLGINETEQTHFYTQVGLDFGGLHVLQSAGLIVYGDFAITSQNSSYYIEYCNSRYKLTLREFRHGFTLETGEAIFTEVGKELLRIVKTEPDRDYEQSIIEFWQKRGTIVEKV